MTQITVIGTTEFVTGFALAGVHHTVVATPEIVLTCLRENKDAGLIILDDALTKGLSSSEQEQIETNVTPVIITLAKNPTAKHERLRRMIISTLGVDLLP